MDEATVAKTKNQENQIKHMKTSIIKVLAAVITMIGISETHAAERSVVDRVKAAAKAINKEVNRPVNPKPCPPIAVRG